MKQIQFPITTILCRFWTKRLFYFMVLLLFPCGMISQTFIGTGGQITDDGQPNLYSLNVSGLSSPTLQANLGLLSVCLTIQHTYDSDLEVILQNPNGTMITLFAAVGGNGENFINTCLQANANQSITTGVSPFSGLYRPQEDLGQFNNGQLGNGEWRLLVIDNYPFADTGSVLNWKLTFGANAPVASNFPGTNLPIVTITTQGGVIQDEPAIPAGMQIIDNGQGNLNFPTDAPNGYNGSIEIEYRGNYSQTLPQKPYKIKTRDSQSNELNVSLLGMPSEHDWVLIANYNDKVFMRNSLAYWIFQQMGHYAPRYRYCEVFVNGGYKGVYLLMEKIKRDAQRVNIARLDPDENSGLDITGGYILKNDLWTTNDSWLLNFHPIDHPDLDVHLVYEYPKPETISTPQKQYIQSFINTFETALYGTNFTSPTLGYRNYIDTPSFIDYFLVNELSRNADGFKKSSYFHKNKDTSTGIGKLKAGPVWDFDWAWKNIPGCSEFEQLDGSGWAHLVNDCNPDNPSTGWFVRLLQDPSFQNELRCRWDFLRQTVLSETSLFNFIDTQAAYLQGAQQRHFERWGNLGSNTGTPEVEEDVFTFEAQIQRFKNWISSRLLWLDSAIPGSSSNCNLSQNTTASRQFQLLPNPAHDEVRLVNQNTITNGEVHVVLIDMQGRKVMDKYLTANDSILQLSQLTPGIYQVIIVDADLRFFDRLIID